MFRRQAYMQEALCKSSICRVFSLFSNKNGKWSNGGLNLVAVRTRVETCKDSDSHLNLHLLACPIQNDSAILAKFGLCKKSSALFVFCLVWPCQWWWSWQCPTEKSVLPVSKNKIARTSWWTKEIKTLVKILMNSRNSRIKAWRFEQRESQ